MQPFLKRWPRTPRFESCLHYSVFLESVAQWIKCYEMSPWLLVSMLMLLWGFLSLFLFSRKLTHPLLQTSSANQDEQYKLSMLMMTISAAISITHKAYQKQYASQRLKLCVVLSNYIYTLTSTSISGWFMANDPTIRCSRGQSDLTRQWTLAFASIEITLL